MKRLAHMIKFVGVQISKGMKKLAKKREDQRLRIAHQQLRIE